MARHRALAALMVWGAFNSAMAGPSPLQRAVEEQAERDPAWIALLHYRPQRNGAPRSQADRASFFLAANGKTSPREELLATLAAIDAPQRRQELACRFPARYEWLRKRFGLQEFASASAQCPQLAAWIARFPGQRISINFASSYLENPSSTFGHTFLKVFVQSNGELLSPTINYAARADASKGQLDFVTRGLFGGFPGVADELPFYRRLRTYTETEGRDIHEYELALQPDEVRQLLLHTWEIKDGAFDYYFLDENCAYRTLALLDVARPGTGLLNGFATVTVPVDTIRALRAAGMVRGWTLWPAFPVQVRQHEVQLPAGDARLARQIALGELAVASLDQLGEARRAAALQLAFEYVSVLIDRDEGDRTTRKDILGAITARRLAASNPAPLGGRNGVVLPEAGHDGGLLSAGVDHRNGSAGLTLGYAAFEHTLASPLAGYAPHAEITILHPELRIGEQSEVRLRAIDWLVAQSTIPATALFAPRAWRLQLVTRSKPFADRDHLATSVAYHSGRAWPVGGAAVLAVLPGVSLEAGRALPRHAGMAGALAVLLTRQSAHWSAQLEWQAERFIAGPDLSRRSVAVRSELALARNLSLALVASQSWAPRREQALQVALKWRQQPLSR